MNTQRIKTESEDCQ